MVRALDLSDVAAALQVTGGSSATTKDAGRAVAGAAAILDWPFERVAPAHGDVVEKDAHGALARALGRRLHS